MNYFIPGQSYIFRCLGTNQTNVITVIFDAAANASVTITQDSILPTDKEANYLFAPTSDYTFDSANSEFEITGDLEKFWYIYFDNPSHNYDNATVAKEEPKKKLTVSCSCKSGSGTCSVSYSVEGDMVCTDCIVAGECMACNSPKWDKTMNVNSTSVLIKAENINM
ncbi:MAG: hypothetical protein K9G64_00540 [Bacteroidia bacterium]|nr:hypothetical protein [Bacteroidia bacterium]